MIYVYDFLKGSIISFLVIFCLYKWYFSELSCGILNVSQVQRKALYELDTLHSLADSTFRGDCSEVLGVSVFQTVKKLSSASN